MGQFPGEFKPNVGISDLLPGKLPIAQPEPSARNCPNKNDCPGDLPSPFQDANKYDQRENGRNDIEV